MYLTVSFATTFLFGLSLSAFSWRASIFCFRACLSFERAKTRLSRSWHLACTICLSVCHWTCNITSDNIILLTWCAYGRAPTATVMHVWSTDQIYNHIVITSYFSKNCITAATVPGLTSSEREHCSTYTCIRVKNDKDKRHIVWSFPLKPYHACL